MARWLPSAHRWRKAALALAMLGLVALPAASGDTLAAAPSQSEAERTVVVVGQARLWARPDAAQLVVGIDSEAPTAQAAQRDNARKARQVMAALDALGIPLRDLQTTSTQLMPVYRYDDQEKQPRLAGYRASYTLRLTLKDLDQVGTVVDSVVAAGANRIDSIRFMAQDTGALENEALTLAVRDAMNQARTLAAAAGVTLGPLLSISGVRFSGAPEPPIVRPLAGRAASEAATTPVEPGLLEFTASVTLTYRLGP
ncbi:SIMPL domain-containing protein [Carboxydochorda subterranea]|uniref:SIMPL domain-containing protein n=1 Tax=Carboxydichorda subterranea TaxID=3109565 RepID=A0ABZ1BY76_9FIRM|nr:SIMPL domain-containing protein [Limnochorda sp. L945t]WRP17654.1 SIMPL domain-containing protein [Limnochorda sp. L945t]